MADIKLVSGKTEKVNSAYLCDDIPSELRFSDLENKIYN